MKERESERKKKMPRKNEVQVSLAIRGGYVPENFQTAKNKTGILG
jgi:hypothetical protein